MVRELTLRRIGGSISATVLKEMAHGLHLAGCGVVGRASVDSAR